jgi:hypothetical protein
MEAAGSFETLLPTELLGITDNNLYLVTVCTVVAFVWLCFGTTGPLYRESYFCFRLTAQARYRRAGVYLGSAILWEFEQNVGILRRIWNIWIHDQILGFHHDEDMLYSGN